MKYVIAAKDASVLERLSQRVRKRTARVRKPHEVGVCVCVCVCVCARTEREGVIICATHIVDCSPLPPPTHTHNLPLPSGICGDGGVAC